MILYHGLKKRVLLVCLISIPLLLPMAWFALHDYQKQRIMTFSIRPMIREGRDTTSSSQKSPSVPDRYGVKASLRARKAS